MGCPPHVSVGSVPSAATPTLFIIHVTANNNNKNDNTLPTTVALRRVLSWVPTPIPLW